MLASCKIPQVCDSTSQPVGFVDFSDEVGPEAFKRGIEFGYDATSIEVLVHELQDYASGFSRTETFHEAWNLNDCPLGGREGAQRNYRRVLRCVEERYTSKTVDPQTAANRRGYCVLNERSKLILCYWRRVDRWLRRRSPFHPRYFGAVPKPG